MNFKLVFLSICFPLILFSQKGNTFKIKTIAFYNVENLFDIENDSLTFDDDRTPQGKDHWTTERYSRKIDNIAKVISDIGSSQISTSPDVLGLCEVENLKVLEDLVNHPRLQKMDYRILHFDSPDERGIDVALIYKHGSFLPTSFQSRRLLLQNDDGERDYTRDQLVVGGLLDDEQIYFIVNHWPSRSGGAERSKPNRLAAAALNKRIIDSIVKQDVSAKIISMGDLNDDPVDDSLKKILKTKGMKNGLEENDLYNPMEKLFKKGIGSLAYRDQWNLFDQMYFTSNFLNSKDGYQFWKANVFTAPYLFTKKGNYKGYPFRTYAGGSYTGGYSDHFPVYLYLIKPVQ
ncbi:endonuclease/exonuclease/phosphatase family protein [Maribacter sp. ANRC-HE7]|uniref:Endonuclease/exonuclease/phosphatase family protein n=1 Tax=Maribacter aquimaris TaxID=2737171 RepID=A0ABR7V3U7_9FLAO|nr:endonuclease/exonuclease/phosphatase family protein [Maribacter aquimaris]MBD0779489.1 endonuclease/exonuclease/phosphatase family protein [Maribacter aquimaris]